jgi:mono/diheme cytochrome c family protein
MKIVKRVLSVIGALLALGVLAMVVKFYVLSPALRPAPDVKAPATPEAIARGKYLATHVAACLGCHSKVDETISGEPIVEGFTGSGRDFGAIPNFPGRIRAPNISPDKDSGIGGWTDGEILRAMREGVDRHGRALFPQMPYQTYAATLGDDDALAIIAYLRTLAPVKNDPGKMTVDFPVSMFIRAAPRPLDKPAPPAPPASNKDARGDWLLRVCSCGDCHDSKNEKMEPIPGKSLAGGMKLDLPGDKGTVYASNITSDKATGVGAYSDHDLKRVINEGKGKSGRTLYVMPWFYYKGLTDEDKDALLSALRRVPPVANVIPAATVK